MDDDFAKDLNDWLDATSDRYVVEQTLKKTPYETTQVVYKRNEKGEPSFGPFVRKIFDDDTERGFAYEQLLLAQTQGKRFSYLPLVYECERVGNRLEVVMEYLQGVTLRDCIFQGQPGMPLAFRIVPHLCDAVTELHESFATPIIHRDIKPSNIIVCEGQIKLIDLGIARAYCADASRDTVRYGTPGYAPPEQFGYGQTDVRSDVYALGMTIAYCFVGEDPSSELRERAFADPRIPHPIACVLAKATQFDPSNRYSTVRELKQAFVDAANVATPHTDSPAASFPATNNGPTVYAGPTTTTNGPTATYGGPAAAYDGPAATHDGFSATYGGPAATHDRPATNNGPATTYDEPAATQPTQSPQPPIPNASMASLVLGAVWDLIVCIFLSMWCIGIALGIPKVSKTPLPVVAVVGVFGIIIPSLALGYVLLDKRLLYPRFPKLAQIRKRKEVLVCVVVAVSSFMLCVLVALAWSIVTKLQAM